METEYAPTYQDRIYKYLFTLKPYGVVVINSICEAKNEANFKAIIKEFIALDLGASSGFYIEFDDDYYSFKKKLLSNVIAGKMTYLAREAAVSDQIKEQAIKDETLSIIAAIKGSEK